ncbi:MAG: LysR family transcriptional regulator [Candidatus Rokubacteria bacterium]|nr:LysR family transcriptional regulator [Candidatus Rokubacteria bacterium]
MHRREYRLAVRHKVWLDAGGRFALGDGGVDLLHAVETAGSLVAAARAVGWSYRHTLAYLANAERRIGRPLVARTRGGHGRGGARLTPAGRDFVRRYARFRRRAERAVLGLYRRAFGAGEEA